MIKYLCHLRPRSGMALFIAGILLGVGAVGTLVRHTQTLAEKRNTAVIIGTALPEQKARVAILAVNVEAQQAFEKNALAAKEEQAAFYILPEKLTGTRMARSVQRIVGALSKNTEENRISLEKIFFEESSSDAGAKTLSGTIKLKGDFRSIARFLRIAYFSGDMMMRDIMSDEARHDFLQQVEAKAPLSLKSAENFLYLDILEYARSPDQYENQLIKDMPLKASLDLKTALLNNGVSRIREALSGIANELGSGEGWPLPMVRIDRLSRSGEDWVVGFTLFGR